jgi:TATA-box binding protein (TBP) (component of TFIID and TFIIIB)
MLENGVLDAHYQVEEAMEQIYQKYFINLDEVVVNKIKSIVLRPIIEQVAASLKSSKNNMISHILYNPEIYPGFSVKIKTPTAKKEKKMTTIKLFPSGKINIDGANNREEAEFLYYWLNDIFCNNPQFIFNEGDENDSDDEFSYSEE